MMRRVLSWLVFFGVTFSAWWFVGPAQIGGPVHYVIVEGDSMRPTYRDGDLVIARAKASYEVGDIVTYRPDVGTDFPVIHRIVEADEDGQFTTQGDNRAEADGWRANDRNILGESWLHIPFAGGVLAYLIRPTSLIGIAGGIGVFQVLVRRERRALARSTRDPRPHLEPTPRRSPASRRGRGMVTAYRVLGTAAAAVAVGLGVRGLASFLTVDGGVLQAAHFGVASQDICGGPCSTVPGATFDGGDSMFTQSDPVSEVSATADTTTTSMATSPSDESAGNDETAETSTTTTTAPATTTPATTTTAPATTTTTAPTTTTTTTAPITTSG